MNHWISPVSLFVLFFIVSTNAQEALTSSTLPTITSYLSESEKSIFSKTKSSLEHSTLLSAINASDLVDLLNYDGQFTIFAPSNLAFNKLSAITISKLLNPKNKKELNKFLYRHIIAGKLSASNILQSMCSGSGTASFTTIHGDELTATMDGIDIVLTDKYGNQAKITTADTNQSNGIIHEIDSVFLPQSPL